MEIEIIDCNFDYPADLRRLSSTERDALQRRHAAYRSAGRATCETSPTRVMDIDEINRIRERKRQDRQRLKEGSEPMQGAPVYDESTGRIVGQFVEGVGYVIDGETSGVRRISKEEAGKLKNAALEAEEIRREAERYSGLSGAERDAEDRFGDII